VEGGSYVGDDQQSLDKKFLMENLYRHVEHLSVGIGERHLWKQTDTIDTLDSDAMAEVLKRLHHTLTRL